MTNTQLKKFIKDYFKPRTSSERIYLHHTVEPFAKKLLELNNDR